jgi:FtsP/CotA-like multicopper oxidase with cupredoxin domain
VGPVKQFGAKAGVPRPEPRLSPPPSAGAPRRRTVRDATKTINTPNEWRDTVIIPPKGFLRVWTRLYTKRVGKTVLHCHFLAHEETAMIQNFLIKPKASAD